MTLIAALIFFGGDASPSGPTPAHSYEINSGGSASTSGYNGPGGWGSFVGGTSNQYTTPGGKAVTIIHTRHLRNTNLIFGLNGNGIVAADFPDRIVCSRGTASVTVVKLGSPRTVTGGMRQDYSVESGAFAGGVRGLGKTRTLTCTMTR